MTASKFPKFPVIFFLPVVWKVWEQSEQLCADSCCTWKQFFLSATQVCCTWQKFFFCATRFVAQKNFSFQVQHGRVGDWGGDA
jgi:hypothetical protein